MAQIQKFQLKHMGPDCNEKLWWYWFYIDNKIQQQIKWKEIIHVYVCIYVKYEK